MARLHPIYLNFWDNTAAGHLKKTVQALSKRNIHYICIANNDPIECNANITTLPWHQVTVVGLLFEIMHALADLSLRRTLYLGRHEFTDKIWIYVN